MSDGAGMLESTSFRIDVEQRPDVVVVAVAGDVDLHTAPVLRDRLADLAGEYVPHVVLDLSETTFLDSMALGVMLGAKKRIDASRGRLDLVVSTPEIQRIFEITLLDRVFDLYETQADAVRDDEPA